MSKNDLHEELRKRILALPGVTERQNAGIHEDAFFIDRAMFMHIHGHLPASENAMRQAGGYCDIRLPKDLQQQVLVEGKARPHRWAPEAGYVTFVVRDEADLNAAMELIQASYGYFRQTKNDIPPASANS